MLRIYSLFIFLFFFFGNENIIFPKMREKNSSFDSALQGTFRPPARHLEKIVYDENRQKLILWGGVELIPNGFKEPTYAAEWDGKTWYQSQVNGPLGRRGHGMVYDAGRKKTVVIGGETQVAKGDSVLFDVWSWDGKKWEPINSECPFKGVEAAYDADNNRLLAYGDVNEKTVSWRGGMTRTFELWEFKANKWQKLSAAGPSPEGSFQVLYHPKRKSPVIPAEEDGKMVLWEWKGNSWHKCSVSVGAPPFRNRYAMAYYPAEDAVYLLGGRNSTHPFLNDFWKWDGENWQKMELQDMPPSRAAHQMVNTENSLLMYGGVLEKGGLSNELWQWKTGKWPQLN